jgi:tetratricopeptide (TPR) repeat protein
MAGSEGSTTSNAPNLIGRAHELGLVRRELVSNAVVVVSGAPGVGKSALAAAFDAAPVLTLGRDRFVPRWIALGGARSPEDVATRVARALGAPARSLAAAAAALAAQRVLAIFDDADGLDPVLEELFAAWRPWSGSGRALVTMRRPLTHARACVVRLRALPPPPPDADPGAIAESPAVELLLAALQRRDAGRTFTEREVSEAAALARAVDGLPLALTALAEVADRVGVHAALPSAAFAALAPRVAESLHALQPDALALARALAVVEGRFELAVADVLFGGPSLAALGTLCHASLVERTSDGDGDGYTMLRPVRAVIASSLDARTSERARRALVSHWASEPRADDAVVDGRAAALAAREPRTRAYRDAIAFGMGREARALFRSIAPAWLAAGPLAQLGELIDAARDLPRDREGDAVFSFFRAMTHLFSGRPKLALAGFAAAERAAPPLLAAVALSQRGVIIGLRGDFARGTAACRRAAALLPRDTPAAIRGRVHKNLATVLAEEGNELALDELARAEAQFQRANDRRDVAFVRMLRLGQLVDGGQLDAAARLAPSVFRALEAVGDHRSNAWAHVIVGIAEQEAGAFGRAREHFARARAGAASVGDEHTSGLVAHYAARLALEEGDAITAAETSIDAVALLEVADDGGHVALALAVLAAAHRMSGRRDAARAGARRAVARAPRRGRAARRAAIRALVAYALGRPPPRLPAISGEEVRFAARFVTGTRRRTTPRDALVVASDGSWFTRGDEPAVQLASSPMLRTLLDVLARLRERKPGSALPAASLAHRLWPHARFDAATKNRLYVGVARLRALGLRDVVEHDAAGYRLDPMLPLRRAG